MKHALEDAGFVQAETLFDDDLIDLGRMSKETRGFTPGGTEGPDCMPWRNGNCP